MKKNDKNRLKEIITLSTKYGFSNGFGNPKNFRLLLEDLGTTFVKIGQLLSTRTDLLSDEYIEELRKLQDNVPPTEFYEVKTIINEDLGDIDDYFIEFDKTPIASASLAQVHYGKLKNGTEVAIKVQRPYIRENIMSDLDIIKKLSPVINLGPTNKIIDMEEVVNEFSIAIEKELNFLEEKENIKKFGLNNKSIKFIATPEVYEDYSSERIIVMDYIDGIKIDNVDMLINEGYDLDDISKKLVYNYFQQVFDHGFFHADPHPGNIFIKNNKIAYLDFGLMGKIDSSMVNKLNNILNSIVLNDMDQLANGILKIGIVVGDFDKNNLKKDIEIIYNKYIDESIYNYDIVNILNEIIQVTKANNIRMPKEITLLAKGMLTIQGVLNNLTKDLSIMEIALPFFKNKLVNEKLKNLDLFDIGLNAYGNIDSISNIPIKTNKILDKFIEDDLNLNIKLEYTDKQLHKMDSTINKIILSIIIAALLISSSLLVISSNMKSYGNIGFIFSAFLGGILVFSIFKSKN